MTGIVTLFMTVSNDAEALQLVSSAVHNGHVACGNIMPGASSIYGWEGQTRNDPEVIVFMKTTADKAEAAIAYLAAMHSYEVPCITVMPVIGGFAPYLDWVRESVAD